MLSSPAKGRVRSSSAMQFLNDWAPIEVTPFPITAFFRDVQLQKASVPIVVTLSGTIIDSIFPQLKNASFPIYSNDPGSSSVVNFIF